MGRTWLVRTSPLTDDTQSHRRCAFVGGPPVFFASRKVLRRGFWRTMAPSKKVSLHGDGNRVGPVFPLDQQIRATYLPIMIMKKSSRNGVHSQLTAICTLFGAVFFASPLSANLIGYWPLDGNTDATAGGWGPSSISAGGNAENDISFVADVPAAISGRATQSIAFDANNDDRVITAFNAGTGGVSGTPSLTLSYWLKPDGLTDNRGVVFLGNATAAGGQVISTEQTGGTQLAAYYFNGNRVTTTGALTQGLWHHIAVTYDTNHGTSRVFVNGVDLSGTTANPANVINIPSDATLSFGGRVSAPNPGNNMRISDLAVWNEVLPDTAIAALAGGISPNQVPEPSGSSLLLFGIFLARRFALKRRK